MINASSRSEINKQEKENKKQPQDSTLTRNAETCGTQEQSKQFEANGIHESKPTKDNSPRTVSGSIATPAQAGGSSPSIREQAALGTESEAQEAMASNGKTARQGGRSTTSSTNGSAGFGSAASGSSTEAKSQIKADAKSPSTVNGSNESTQPPAAPERKSKTRINRLLSIIRPFNGEAVERYAQNKWKDVLPLEDIFMNHPDDHDDVAATPYQCGFCAELAEEPFIRLSQLLRPRQADESLSFRWSRTRRRLEPSLEAIDTFGELFAQCMVTAANQIDLSGIVWGSQWMDGIIRGVNCGGYIKPQMLLLCLASERFYLSEPQHLMEIVKSLDCMELIEKAITHWGWEDDYYYLMHPPSVEDLSKPSVAGSTSKNELKFFIDGRNRERIRFAHCLLFCTRVYSCELYFETTSRSAQLEKKLRDCLGIMLRSIIRKYPSLAKREKIVPDLPFSRSNSSKTSWKNGKASQQDSDDEMSKGDTTGESEDDEEDQDEDDDENEEDEEDGEDEDSEGEDVEEEEEEEVVPKRRRSILQGEDDEEYVYVEEDNKDQIEDDLVDDRKLAKQSSKKSYYGRSGRYGHKRRRISAGGDSTNGRGKEQRRAKKARRGAASDESMSDEGDGYDRDEEMDSDDDNELEESVRGSHAIVSLDTSSSTPPAGDEASSVSCDGLEAGDTSSAKRRIEVVCPNSGEVVATFVSTEVIKSIMVLTKGNALGDVLSGKTDLWRGYKWRYRDTTQTDKFLANLKFSSPLDSLPAFDGTAQNRRLNQKHTSRRGLGITVIDDDESMLAEDAGGSAHESTTVNTSGGKKAGKAAPVSDGPPMIRPYSETHCAETGEEPFDTIARFFVADENSSDAPAPMDAVHIFGPTLAKSLVKARRQITRSTIVYDVEWRHGMVDGMSCGFIPRAMLLLCLKPSDFAKQSTFDVGTLAKIITDLGVSQMVRDAISDWKIEGNFRKLKASGATLSYDDNLAECQRCEVFVARAYRAIKALRRHYISASLMRKVKACLTIMESNIKSKTPTQLSEGQAALSSQSPLSGTDGGRFIDPTPTPAAGLETAEGRGESGSSPRSDLSSPAGYKPSLPLIKRRVNLQASKLDRKAKAGASPKPRHKTFKRVVKLCQKSNKPVAMYRSANAACLILTGNAAQSMLYRCLKGHAQAWKGFAWRYEADCDFKVDEDLLVDSPSPTPSP